MKMLKYIMVMLSMIALTASAGSYTLTWVSNILPPPPHNGHRVAAQGSFTVTEESVNRGIITPSDVLVLNFSMESPANYHYSTFDGGSLNVNPSTHVVGLGSLHSTCFTSTYGRGCNFSTTRVWTDNPVGGAWSGHWIVIYNPSVDNF